MKVVVDTSVLIDHLRGVPAAIDALIGAVRRGDELWSVAVVRTEVLVGMRPTEAAPTHVLLDQFHWLDVDPALADQAGELGRRYLRSHPGVDTVDYLIAAAAQSLGARLLTTNVRHFPMFDDLVPAYT